MAEGQGFEPWDGRPSPVFKTGAFDHSATPPEKPEIIPRFVSETSILLKKTYKSARCGDFLRRGRGAENKKPGARPGLLVFRFSCCGDRSPLAEASGDSGRAER